MPRSIVRLGVASTLALAACGGGHHDGAPDAAHDVDGAPVDASGTCPRVAAAADRERRVVVSRPTDAAGNDRTEFDVLTLSTDGTLATTDVTFDLGVASGGAMAFTPDGAVGIVAQDDGTLGVVRFDGATPTVVHAAFAGGFYASSVTIAADGAHAFVLDGDTSANPDNGGGIWEVAIGCDGTLTDLGRVLAQNSPGALALLDDDRAVVAGGTDPAAGAASTDDVQLYAWGAVPSLVGSARAFPGDDAIVGGAALLGDLYLVGAVNDFTTTANQVTAVRLGASAVAVDAPTLTIEDPVGIAASPFGNAALVLSGLGNALYRVAVTPASQPTLALHGEVTYVGAAPALPSAAVVIGAGGLTGHVLVAEASAIRQLAFAADGNISDLGALQYGDAVEDGIGAIGVQP